LETQRRRKMTKLCNIVGVAFVAMSLLTGFAINTAHADDSDGIISNDEREIIMRDRDEARLVFEQ
jgi:hypothetical protein